jgi:hypothetical protein
MPRRWQTHGPGRGKKVLSPSTSFREKPAAKKPRAWRVLLMRARSQNLGIVYAANAEAAEAAAVAEFNIRDDQRRRLIVREQG